MFEGREYILFVITLLLFNVLADMYLLLSILLYDLLYFL